MSKYDVPDEHWEGHQADQPPNWQERTSAEIDLQVTLHDEGYQNDRRWTVHIRQGHRDHPVAVYAGEHQNKGNYWREPNLWRDAVDFAELPDAVQQRVADLMNRSVAEITPEDRMIHREDGTGVGDREEPGTCDVCDGNIYDPEMDRHPGCLPEDGDS